MPEPVVVPMRSGQVCSPAPEGSGATTIPSRSTRPRYLGDANARTHIPHYLAYFAAWRMTPTRRQTATSLILWNWLALLPTGSTPPASKEPPIHVRHDLHNRQPQPGPRGQLPDPSGWGRHGAGDDRSDLDLSLPLPLILTRPSEAVEGELQQPGGRGSIHMEL